jgi:CheY-like chemotaxis protein
MDSQKLVSGGATILVVDDEEHLRDFLCLILEELGHRVLVATNGRQALALVRAHHPDLVISDVKMPGMSGLELCRTLKHDAEAAGDEHLVPFILTSSAGAPAAQDSQADDFLDKPYEFGQIKDVVRHWLKAA